ncbi:MAG TPA: hypothetical protein VFG37_06635 [Planctomycetota bacterium]|nr:hypothetical protein [Planctomycetota bacterium]
MKEFDFVKLTLWIALVLTAALGGGYFWLGMKLDELSTQIRNAETTCRRVGQISHDIRMLNDEKQNDKTPEFNETGINSYFATCARGPDAARPMMDPNDDYTLHPKDAVPSKDKTYQDTQYVLDFKRDHYKSRDQIFTFIWNVERSRRIKLARAKISLVAERAPDDVWVPESLTFDRRDPVGAKPKAAESK